ncbi:MAG: hypothetical protein HYY37_04880 [Candidatus Aenigmarchaeota archaeon]|nr:hypothetical protein [Candidatus Aenigmarchaeota archaeon]
MTGYVLADSEMRLDRELHPPGQNPRRGIDIEHGTYDIAKRLLDEAYPTTNEVAL